MRTLPPLILLLASLAGHAETPQQIGKIYATEAATQQAGFTPSAKRGEAIFPSALRPKRQNAGVHQVPYR